MCVQAIELPVRFKRHNFDTKCKTPFYFQVFAREERRRKLCVQGTELLVPFKRHISILSEQLEELSLFGQFLPF